MGRKTTSELRNVSQLLRDVNVRLVGCIREGETLVVVARDAHGQERMYGICGDGDRNTIWKLKEMLRNAGKLGTNNEAERA